MPMNIGDDEDTASRAEETVEFLVDAFETLAKQGAVKVKDEKSRLFYCTYGWWAGITRSCEALVVLRRAGLEHEAAPIVRSVLQHSLVLQWLIETGDQALDAVTEYGETHMRLLLDTLATSNWPLPDGLAPTPPPRPAVAHPLLPMLKSFDQLCRAYDAHQLYVPFRLLSAYAHPTAVSANVYLDLESGNLESRATGHTRSNIVQAAICLIQAWKVMNTVFYEDLLNAPLAEAQNRLGSEIGLWTKRP
jgi:hypothetical protein